MKRPITIFDPSRVFSDNFMDSFFGGAGINFQYTNDLEMYEEGDNVVVKLKVPGFNDDQIGITIEDRTLTISGEVKEETEEENKNKKYYYKEMRQQSFTRSIPLPIRVDADKAVAEIKNGIVNISMPKAEDAKPRSVTVKKVVS